RLGCGVLLEGSAPEILAALEGSVDDARALAGPAARDASGESPGLAVTIPASGGGSWGPAATAPAAMESPVHAYRILAAGLAARGSAVPIVLTFDAAGSGDAALLEPSLVLGSLLCDGIGDAVRVRAADPAASRPLAFNILQGARVRTSKTEFISCPSCGRTLFDLEET